MIIEGELRRGVWLAVHVGRCGRCRAGWWARLPVDPITKRTRPGNGVTLISLGRGTIACPLCRGQVLMLAVDVAHSPASPCGTHCETSSNPVAPCSCGGRARGQGLRHYGPTDTTGMPVVVPGKLVATGA